MREREWSASERVRTIAFGVLDICALVFLFMPLFKVQLGCIVSSVSLLEYSGTSLKPLYLFAIVGTAILGVVTLLSQVLKTVVLKRAVVFFSLIAGFVLLLLFIAGSLPYAAAVALLLLAIKAFFFIKCR